MGRASNGNGAKLYRRDLRLTLTKKRDYRIYQAITDQGITNQNEYILQLIEKGLDCDGQLSKEMQEAVHKTVVKEVSMAIEPLLTSLTRKRESDGYPAREDTVEEKKKSIPTNLNSVIDKWGQ